MKCARWFQTLTLLSLSVLAFGLDAEARTQDAPAPTATPTPAPEISPELKRQLRALFEPLRKPLKKVAKADAAVLKSLGGDDVDAMKYASAKLQEASDELAVRKNEVIGKAEKAGATPGQIQAEWTSFLREVEQQQKK
jgi:hypothetical protein